MCKTHSKVTHIKQQKYFYHFKGRGYNTQSLLYPRPLRWWKYFCCFICVTLLWVLHIVIKQQFFTFIFAVFLLNLTTLYLHSTPPLGVPSEYRHDIWYGKTIMVWLPDSEQIFEDMFTRFDRIHKCDRRTDRQTDTAWRHRPRIASRGKSYSYILFMCLSVTKCIATIAPL